MCKTIGLHVCDDATTKYVEAKLVVVFFLQRNFERLFKNRDLLIFCELGVFQK